ncbi:oxidoreductase [Edaphobacter bradus]|uniref:oxidoreductase n=1 Tax=Edaphobacter bradus TaxID=2259016 RepID=UPI0021E0C10A|nr:hypothetical protein [Edaphobacter bradus]
MNKLLSPLSLGPYVLRNRVVMAPLTRTRAGERNVPREMNVEYYRRHASAGLIITEATPVSPYGLDLGPDRFRRLITGEMRLIAAGGYKPADAESLLERGDAEAVAFGRLFIANPDLPRRIALDAKLNVYDRSTFYTRETKGYTDYPSLEQQEAANRQSAVQEKEYVEVER